MIASKFQTLKPELNERQRCLWAASEAMCLGQAVSALLVVRRGFPDRRFSKASLKVYAMEDHNIHPTKRKITDQQLNALNIIKNDILG